MKSKIDSLKIHSSNRITSGNSSQI